MHVVTPDSHAIAIRQNFDPIKNQDAPQIQSSLEKHFFDFGGMNGFTDSHQKGF